MATFDEEVEKYLEDKEHEKKEITDKDELTIDRQGIIYYEDIYSYLHKRLLDYGNYVTDLQKTIKQKSTYMHIPSLEHEIAYRFMVFFNNNIKNLSIYKTFKNQNIELKIISGDRYGHTRYCYINSDILPNIDLNTLYITTVVLLDEFIIKYNYWFIILMMYKKNNKGIIKNDDIESVKSHTYDNEYVLNYNSIDIEDFLNKKRKITFHASILEDKSIDFMFLFNNKIYIHLLTLQDRNTYYGFVPKPLQSHFLSSSTYGYKNSRLAIIKNFLYDNFLYELITLNINLIFMRIKQTTLIDKDELLKYRLNIENLFRTKYHNISDINIPGNSIYKNYVSNINKGLAKEKIKVGGVEKIIIHDIRYLCHNNYLDLNLFNSLKLKKIRFPYYSIFTLHHTYIGHTTDTITNTEEYKTILSNGEIARAISYIEIIIPINLKDQFINNSLIINDKNNIYIIFNPDVLFEVVHNNSLFEESENGELVSRDPTKIFNLGNYGKIQLKLLKYDPEDSVDLNICLLPLFPYKRVYTDSSFKLEGSRLNIIDYMFLETPGTDFNLLNLFAILINNNQGYELPKPINGYKFIDYSIDFFVYNDSSSRFRLLLDPIDPFKSKKIIFHSSVPDLYDIYNNYRDLMKVRDAYNKYILKTEIIFVVNLRLDNKFNSKIYMGNTTYRCRYIIYKIPKYKDFPYNIINNILDSASNVNTIDLHKDKFTQNKKYGDGYDDDTLSKKVLNRLLHAFDVNYKEPTVVTAAGPSNSNSNSNSNNRNKKPSVLYYLIIITIVIVIVAICVISYIIYENFTNQKSYNK